MSGKFQPIQNFDGLAPTTTKGDIIVHNGTTNVRLPVGGDGLYLKANSGSADGVTWSISSISNAVTSKSASYTITTADYLVAYNGISGPVGFTLPTAVGNAGLIFETTKTDSTNDIMSLISVSNQTIGAYGETIQIVSARGEVLSVISDNVNWQIYSKHVARNEVLLNTYTSYGTLNNKIIRFNQSVVNGGALTYADSVTLGMSVTVNRQGSYAISMVWDADNVNDNFAGGISKNSAQLTTAITGITFTTRLTMFNDGAKSTATGSGAASWTGWLDVASVIRFHTDGKAPATASKVSFNIISLT